MDIKFDYLGRIVDGKAMIESIKSKSESEWLLEVRFYENDISLPVVGCYTINRIPGEDPYETANKYIQENININ